MLVGCRQVVRHLVLVQTFGGSSPSIPDFKNSRLGGSFFISLYWECCNVTIGFQDGLDAFLSAMMPNCWEFKAGL